MTVSRTSNHRDLKSAFRGLQKNWQLAQWLAMAGATAYIETRADTENFRAQVTLLYTAPTAIRALQSFGDDFVKKSSRKSLRILGTVGEPINPEAWKWYHEVHPCLCLAEKRMLSSLQNANAGPSMSCFLHVSPQPMPLTMPCTQA